MKQSIFLPTLFFILCGLSRLTFGQERGQKPIVPQPMGVSIINLIATPERYDGKMVSVVGFLAVESEDARLYLSEEDYRRNIMDNGIFIDANKELTREIESKDLHYVHIAGVFRMKGLPIHFPGGAGEAGITDIRQCLPLPELTNMRPRKLKDSQTQNPH